MTEWNRHCEIIYCQSLTEMNDILNYIVHEVCHLFHKFAEPFSPLLMFIAKLANIIAGVKLLLFN